MKRRSDTRIGLGWEGVMSTISKVGRWIKDKD